MKKISLFLFFMLAMFLVVTVACGKEEQATTYTVSFVTGTTETIANQTVKENEKVVKPTDPKKDGADFLGWYVNGAEYDFNKGVTSNLTLTAKWDAFFTVTFNTGTDATIDSQKVKTDGKVVKPADPVKDGYVFKGWQTAEGEYDFDAAVTNDLALTAKWAQLFTVNFITMTDEKIDAQTIEANGNVVKPTDPTREGYVFKGWQTTSGEYDFDAAVTKNLVLTAKWAQLFTVSFITMTDENITAQTIEANGKAVKPADPTREGYVFEGWKTASGKFDFSSEITANVVLSATWSKIHTVTFMADGKVVSTQKVKDGDPAVAPKNSDVPTVTGKEFTGWLGDFDTITADTVIEAIYEPIQYLVAFIVDGNQYGDTVEVLYGEDAQMPADPEKPGYTFTGWDAEAKNVTSNLTLTAEFTINTYNIKYYANGAEVTTSNPATYTVEDAISLGDYNVSELYFAGWFNNAALPILL